MPSKRDLLKAIGGLVLATGGSWLASHAHGASEVASARGPQNAVAGADAIDAADPLQAANGGDPAKQQL